MITAEFSSRTYVHYLTIAMQFADIHFNGDNYSLTNKLNRIGDIIKNAQQDKNAVRIECLNKKKESNKQEINKLNSELKEMHKRLISLLIHKNSRLQAKDIKKKIKQLTGMNETIDVLIYTIKQYDNQWNGRYSHVYTLCTEYKSLLSDFGFSIKSSHNNTNSDINYIFYEFNGDETELSKKVDDKLQELETDLEKRKSNIITNYTEKLNNNELPDPRSGEWLI